MRKGFDGLAVLVQQVLSQDPHSGALFAFRGKRGHLVKLLWFDGQGLCLFSKRLDRGRFVWPVTARPARPAPDSHRPRGHVAQRPVSKQAALFDGAVGHRRHAAHLEPRQQVMLGPRTREVVEDLVGGVVTAASGDQFVHVGNIEIADASVADFAGRPQRFHRLDRLPPRDGAAPV